MEELKRIVCSGNFVILFLLVFLVNGFFYEKKQYSVDEEERIYGEDFDYASVQILAGPEEGAQVKVQDGKIKIQLPADRGVILHVKS